jgi:dihydrofolate synthase/folylpolyglutamate synthase
LPETNLAGTHQRRNAGAALLACELATRLPIDDAKALAALRAVEWAGRWQEFRLIDGRRLIVDGSHNEEGIRAVAPLLAALNAPTVIVGALGVDRARPLVAAAAKAAGRLVLVRPDNERACSVEELAALVPADFRGEVRRATVAELFPSPATCAAEGETIVVLGSLYLVGEVLARLRGHVLPDAWQDRLPSAR